MAGHARKLISECDQLRSRLEQAATLLDDALDPECMEYDTQGVNQAHRVLRGGDPPRPTKPHPVDEGAP